MKTIDIQWKEFNVDLEALKAEIDTLVPGKCVGISGNSVMQVHLDDSVSDEEIGSIVEYVEALTEDSDEVKSYRSSDQIKQAIESLKEGIPAKTWNQLSGPERKIVMGMTPTKAELITAELL